jgi:hypothetical protein
VNPDDERHGTYAGYQAGCSDECCRAALREYMRNYRATNTKAYDLEKERTAARSRALWRLAELHPEKFQEFYLDEIGAPKRVMAP